MSHKVGQSRSTYTGITYYQVNFQNKTPCAERVLPDYINVAACGTRPEVRSRSEDILPPLQEAHTVLGKQTALFWNSIHLVLVLY